jgi:CheY-like chemotaxis protein
MSLTVLIVDDYPDARLLLSFMLEDAGFQVLQTDTGPKAIEMAREHRPAAIVMDIHLPGMSGVDAAQALRADPELARIPIVAHTLSPEPLTDSERGLFDAVFGKPSAPDALVEILHRAIRANADG